MKTERLEDPCSVCLLRKNAITNTGGRTPRFLVVCKPPSGKQITDGANLTPQARKLFAEYMRKAGFNSGDFVFTNSIKCSYDPTRHITKDRHVIEGACREHLLRLIERMKPEVIIPMGAAAAQAVYGRSVKITKIRGVPDRSLQFDTLILPIMDPSFVHIYPQHKDIFASDCETLKRVVHHNYDLEAAEEEVLGDYRKVYDLQFLIDNPPPVLSYDLETLGTEWQDPSCKIMTIQVAVNGDSGFLIPWDHPDDPAGMRMKQRISRQLKQILQNPYTSVIGQNAKYDLVWTIDRLGFNYRIDHDTIMMAACLDENMQSKDLSTLTKMYAPEMAGYDDTFNSKYDKSRMDLVPLNAIVGYGVGDCCAVFKIFSALLPEIEKDQKLWRYYRRAAMPGINMFASVEPRGMRVDETALGELDVRLEAYLKVLNTKLLKQVASSIKRKHVEAGIKFTRRDFLRDILFDHEDGLRLEPVVYTKGTENLAAKFRVPSTSTKDHLPYFFEEHPFTVDLSEYIKLERLLSTNIRSFREKYIQNSHVYPIYSLWTATTGRSSCLRGDVPVDTKRGKVRADEVKVGDEVWTHKGRWREVSRLFHKPVTAMYDVCFTNGEVLTCTADHIVLLNSGKWTSIRAIIEKGIRYAEYIQEADERHRTHQAGSSSVQEIADDSTAGSGPLRCEPCNGPCDDWEVRIKGGFQKTLRLSLPQEQVGGEESSIWEAMGVRLRGWVRVSDATSARGAVLCTSDSDGGESGVACTGSIESAHSTSRGWRSDEQPYRQSGVNDKHGSCEDTQNESMPYRDYGITSIDRAGSYRVYDFQVEEDHSYLSCGVFSHNSRSPNGQNYPKRGEFAQLYRNIFIPSQNCVMIEADLSQAELRIAAALANDKTMLRIFQEGGDIHTATACIVMRVTLEEFHALSKAEQKLARFKAKAVNFGFIFGMGWRKFIVYAKTQYGVEFSEAEARRIRSQFFKKYRSLPIWHNLVREFVMRHGYVRSYSGRIRHLPMIWSEDEKVAGEASRQAINSPVQGFASDLGVMAMNRIHREIDPKYMQMVGFVHDAIYVIVPEEYLEWGAKTLKHYMESNPLKEWFNLDLKVPITADVGFGWRGGSTYEMGKLEQDIPYDFAALEDEYDVDFELMKQKVPEAHGRREIREYMEIHV